MNSKELAKMIRYLQITAKKKRELLMVTLHQNVSLKNFPTFSETYLSTLSDNILILTFSIEDNKLVRNFLMLKQRSNDHSKKIYRIERGIEIYGPEDIAIFAIKKASNKTSPALAKVLEIYLKEMTGEGLELAYKNPGNFLKSVRNLFGDYGGRFLNLQ